MREPAPSNFSHTARTVKSLRALEGIPLLLGETVGWKSWRVERDGLTLSEPLAAGRVWEPAFTPALCQRCQLTPARFQRCYCGWRAEPSPPEPVRRFSAARAGIVYGAVALRGLVCSEPLLIRAERERLLAVWSGSLSASETAAIAEALGVYAHPSLGSVTRSIERMGGVDLSRPMGLSRWELI